MRFSFRALVWFFATLGGGWVLLQFESKSDPIVRALVWGYVVAVSVGMAVLALRRGGFVSHDAALPEGLRRWMHGESEKASGRNSLN
jgi:hypothetical protein